MKYNRLHIKKLANLYWAGEASPEQEGELAHLCGDAHFCDDFPELAFYLQSLEGHQEIEVPKNLTKSILNQTTQKPGTLKPLLWFSGIAATLALIIWILPAQQNHQYTDEEVQKAYQETKNALFLISNKMEEGNHYALKLGEFEKNQEKIMNTKKTNTKNK